MPRRRGQLDRRLVFPPHHQKESGDERAGDEDDGGDGPKEPFERLAHHAGDSGPLTLHCKVKFGYAGGRCSTSSWSTSGMVIPFPCTNGSANGAAWLPVGSRTSRAG